MNTNQLFRGKPLAAVIAALVLLLPVGYSTVSALLSRSSEAKPLFLATPENAERGCIRELEYMRFRHMDLLTEMRDAGVRHGARRDVTFNDCAVCHTSREQFCDRCHDAVNLDPDCFECHYYP